MKKEKFIKSMTLYKAINDSCSSLYDVGVDLYESRYAIVDDIDRLKDELFGGYYNEQGVDLINWFIFENEWGTRDWSKYVSFTEGIEMEIEKTRLYGMTDDEGNEVCHNIESLWEYIEKNCKNKK